MSKQDVGHEVRVVFGMGIRSRSELDAEEKILQTLPDLPLTQIIVAGILRNYDHAATEKMSKELGL